MACLTRRDPHDTYTIKFTFIMRVDMIFLAINLKMKTKSKKKGEKEEKNRDNERRRMHTKINNTQLESWKRCRETERKKRKEKKRQYRNGKTKQGKEINT